MLDLIIIGSGPAGLSAAVSDGANAATAAIDYLMKEETINEI